MKIEDVYSQIEKYLGKPVGELFASFDEQPMGSASIAQVHKAELPDGTVVAVKVRRPGVVDTVARDFALIEKILYIGTCRIYCQRLLCIPPLQEYEEK